MFLDDKTQFKTWIGIGRQDTQFQQTWFITEPYQPRRTAWMRIKSKSVFAVFAGDKEGWAQKKNCYNVNYIHGIRISIFFLC